MAQSSAQREPSMEEILASIRRIIEDSDTDRKPEDEAVEAEEPAGGFSVADVDAFRSELRSGANDPLPIGSPAPEAWTPPRPLAAAEKPPAAAPIAANGSRPFSMADIEADLASGRSDSRTTSPIVPEAAPQHVGAPAQPVMSATKPTVAASPEVVSAFGPAAAADDDEDAELDQAISAALEKATLANDLREQSSRSDREDYADTGLAKHDRAPAAARGPIISDETSRQVAAAFGELSEAFAASRRKSFDDLAEEMMRPMLQDWLDNNLPTLVEKLVREEIERIARGAQ